MDTSDNDQLLSFGGLSFVRLYYTLRKVKAPSMGSGSIHENDKHANGAKKAVRPSRPSNHNKTPHVSSIDQLKQPLASGKA